MDKERYPKVDCLFLYTGGEPEQYVRPESVGFRYWKTPVKTSYSHLQASGSVSWEGGRNGSQVRNPTVDFTNTVRSPETSEPASKHPACRRGSMPSSGCARKFSSSISSITITSRKVMRSSSLPDTSRPIQSSMEMNDHPNDSPGALSTPVPPQRKALVVKVTEQRTIIKTTPRASAIDQNTDHKGYDHPVVLRRKASIVKTAEQMERFDGGQPDTTKTAQYRHSYTEGLKHDFRSGDDDKANPSMLNRTFTVSLQPGGNQWRSSTVQHRSSVSLHLNNPSDSRTVHESDSKKYETPRRPLSCDAGLFIHTDPAFHNKSSPLPQKTNIHLVSSSKGQESGGFVSSIETGNLDGVIPRKEEFEPVLGIQPLTLFKVPDDSPPPTARAVLALNAAAVIANIKLQTRQKQNRNEPAETQTTSHASAAADDGKSNDGGVGDGRIQPIICFGSEDVPPDCTSTPLSLKEALALRRPDFIQRSQARVQALERRSWERQKTLSSPQRPQPTCSQHQEDDLLKPKDRRVSGKDAHLRSRRNYNLLSEVRKRREDKKRKKEEETRKVVSRTNRLRVELFKKKLLDQVLQRGNN